jgi:hypothetical protein
VAGNFPRDRVAATMSAIVNIPVAANQVQQPSRIGAPMYQAGDPRDSFHAPGCVDRTLTSQAKHWPDARPIQLVIEDRG